MKESMKIINVSGCSDCPYKKKWKELWCDKMEPLQKIAFHVHNLTFHPDCPLEDLPDCTREEISEDDKIET